jgi:hypothetical protein
LRYYDACGLTGGDWGGGGGGAGHALAGSDGGDRANDRGGQGGQAYGSADLSETIFPGSGGGGGSLNESLSGAPGSTNGIGAGSNGGGIVYIGCASYIGRSYAAGGGLPTLQPSGSVNNVGGGGAGGSIFVESSGAVTGGGAGGGDASFNTGGGGHGSGVHNWSDSNPSYPADSPGGAGSKGRVDVRYGSYTDLGLGPVADADSYQHIPLAYPHYVGCWTSAIYDSAALGMAAGLSLRPTSVLIDWTPDADGLPPTFYLEGGEAADLSDAVPYPATGEVEVPVSGVKVDLGGVVTAAHLYWRLTVCLDSGASSFTTPTVGDVQLCGIA